MLRTQSITKISRILLYTTAILPFILQAGFTFPYVTVRTALFRIIIEIVVLLVLFAWATGRITFMHMRRQYFFWVFAGLIAVESVAALFGESWTHSFFGDMERMWGIVTVAHLFAFYALARILFNEQSWRVFFHVSLMTSVAVSVYGIVQHYPDVFRIYLYEAGASRIGSTLGNPVYVSLYLLFNIAFALYLLFKAKRGGWWYFYISAIAVNFYAFTFTDIRGSYLGLIIGAAAAALGYVFLGKRKSIKRGILACMILGAVVLVLGFQFKRSDIVRSVPILRRVVTISINDGTSQTRFIGWNAAWQSFLHDPLTGVGMENYNIPFNAYFPARYYLLAPTETYFDRAHNQFFNILAESGIIALLLYLAFPVCIGYYLVRGYRSNRFALAEFLLFGGLSIAYFVHLFFVFDDFHSLFFFAAFIGLLEFRYRGEITQFVSVRNESAAHPRRALPIAAFIVLLPIVWYSIVRLNVDVLRAAKETGAAFLTNDVGKSLAYYRKALKLNLIPSENVTINFTDYLIGLPKYEDNINADPKLKANVLDAFSQNEAALLGEVRKKPNDAAFYLKLGQLNNGWFLADDNIGHLADAITYLERARDLSPGRIQMYLVLGESYVLADQSKKAIDVLEEAVNLEPKFGAPYYYLGRALLTDGQLDEAYEAIVNKAFIEHHYLPEDKTIALVLADELASAGEYKKTTTIYEYLAGIDRSDARIQSALASAYLLDDRLEDAIYAALKAAELDPSFAPEAQAFIREIQEGRIDELKQNVF